MNFILGISLLLICTVTTINSLLTSDDDKTTLEQILNIEHGYDPRIHPHMEEGIPVKVNSTLFVLDVISVDDHKKEFTISFYFRLSWNDPRLQYISKRNDTKGRFLMPKDYDKIWMPGVFFAEERTGKLHSTIVQNSLLRIVPNGDTYFSAKLSETFKCPMSVSLFPFDVQKCRFSIECYAHTSDLVDLNWKNNKSVSVIQSADLYNFNLTGFDFSKENEEIGNWTYVNLYVEFSFARKVGFYLANIYIPYIILSMLSWLSFWIKPGHLALRLTLLFSILIIMLYLSTSVMNYIPPASYTKGIEVWTAICITLVFSAFLEFLFVSQCYAEKREEEQECKENLEQNGKSEEMKIAEKDEETALSKDKPFSLTFLMRGGANRSWSESADGVSRIAFPALFVFFNLIYWPVYAA